MCMRQVEETLSVILNYRFLTPLHFLEQQARKKAGRLVGMVRVPSALESQGGFAQPGIPTITAFALSLEVAS